MPASKLILPAAGAFALGLSALPLSGQAAPLPTGAGVMSSVGQPIVQVASRRVARAYGPRRGYVYRNRGNRGAALAAGAILGAVTAGAVAASQSRSYGYDYAPQAYGYDGYGGGYGYAPVASGYYGDGYAPVASGYYGGGYAPVSSGYYGYDGTAAYGYDRRAYRARGYSYGGVAGYGSVGGPVAYGQGYRGEGYYEGGRYLGNISSVPPGN